jgi:Ca-activated chloride channel family protein
LGASLVDKTPLEFIQTTCELFMNTPKKLKRISNKINLILSSSLLLLTLAGCSSGTKDTSKKDGITDKKQILNSRAEVAQPEQLQEIIISRDAMVMVQTGAYPVHKQRFRVPSPVVVESENYQDYPENGVNLVSQQPVSTFSIDVDTGSYTNVRRMLNQGVNPPKDAIRIEEFINFFDYDYSPDKPESTNTPFSIDTAIATSPWSEQRHILRVALKGYTPDKQAIAGRNLVFLLDVSGSMAQANKLPLLTRSLSMLTEQLTGQDSVSIVVYAGASGVVLKPTKGDNKAKIKQALSRLSAGGSTNGQAGIELAYNMAEQAFIQGGVNRVILATDGDFNVGLSDFDGLIALIKQQRKKGIALTTLGFGQGNYNDHLMEQLADSGNGNYAYIDTIHEARKVLVDEMDATLLTIAKDVKIQVEFNPNQVTEYRLLGYENRKLKQEDFNNDVVDAGEIGAGHTVTAFYELTLTDSNNAYVDTLRYQQNNKKSVKANQQLANEIATVKLRYKPIDEDKSQLISRPVFINEITDFNQQSDDFRFASSVIGFAHLLKQSHYWQDVSYQQIIQLAQETKGLDSFGYRAEFIQLVRTQASLQSGLQSGLQSSSKVTSTMREQQTQNLDLNLQGFSRKLAAKPTLLTQH